jgi:hypothetical protein
MFGRLASLPSTYTRFYCIYHTQRNCTCRSNVLNRTRRLAQQRRVNDGRKEIVTMTTKQQYRSIEIAILVVDVIIVFTRVPFSTAIVAPHITGQRLRRCRFDSNSQS